MNPLVSVIMPAYNAAPHITAALESILSQPTGPLEIIVVNDGSTDATPELAAAFGAQVNVLHQANLGITPALNRGIEAARGEYLAFLDADDLWTPGRLKAGLDAFRADPSLSIVFGHMQNFYSPEVDADYRARIICEPNPMPGIWYHTMLIRRADFFKIGLFEPQWVLGNFMEWFERVNALDMAFTILPDILLLRRLHPNNSGIRLAASRRDYARVLKTLIDRKRRKNSVPPIETVSPNSQA